MPQKRSAGLLALSLALLVWTVSCLPPKGVAGIAAPQGEDVWRRHLEVLGQRMASRFQSQPEAGPPKEQEGALVEEYFALSGQIRRLDREVQEVRAQSVQVMAALGQQVDWARRRRDLLKGPVEAILARQVGEGLNQAELVVGLRPGEPSWIFPPAQFFLLKPPLVLVTSPRERIEVSGSYLLGMDLSQATLEDMERRAEAQGVSALVERTGGFGLYPAWVSEDHSLPDALEAAAHEWAHAYLSLFYPLGRAYFQDYRMRTINETVADMVGKEVGAAVYRRYYAFMGPPTPSAALRERQADFARQMRRIRAAVEGMLALPPEGLAQGQVEKAEAYMEAERINLVARGYPLRRLNQAYLALHGTYADEPGFESPLGAALRDLRARSPSLGEFVRRVGYISSYGEFQRLLGETGSGP